jgi:hypothetical protein
MNRVVAGLLWSLVLGFFGYGLLFAYSAGRDRAGMAATESILKVVAEKRQIEGEFPAHLEAFPTKVFGIFPGPEVRYIFQGSDCSVHFSHWPFGPKMVKNCGGGDWYFED